MNINTNVHSSHIKVKVIILLFGSNMIRNDDGIKTTLSFTSDKNCAWNSVFLSRPNSISTQVVSDKVIGWPTPYPRKLIFVMKPFFDPTR